MSFLLFVLVGLVVGVTTVLFGFGGGFVTVPVIAVAHAGWGGDAVRVATATSALVMLVNATVATVSTRRAALQPLARSWMLFGLLAVGGAVGAVAARFAPDQLIRWGFVVYVGATIVDLLIRPGFIRKAPGAVTAGGARVALVTPALRKTPQTGVHTWLGLPIGSVAAFLGVGGSVMTVPMMRRAGASMASAATLANPLTLAIVAPALVISSMVRGGMASGPGLVGSVDVLAASGLLLGSIPLVVVMRRRPPRIPDGVHAWTYVALLIAAGVTVAISG